VSSRHRYSDLCRRSFFANFETRHSLTMLLLNVCSSCCSVSMATTLNMFFAVSYSAGTQSIVNRCNLSNISSGLLRLSGISRHYHKRLGTGNLLTGITYSSW
jgi:hypothetical protein